ncbi:sugar kinase [Acidocella aquatica]|uniref:Sugar kinase n=1 Tax=Acidocella aquatica TaxID=1922313 RepID=A0ABQ6A183_9PROT|nr:ROK family transcriptional regulator [Acidocella aquatica]GLR65929.1 sugar kinase [Acidocella aquatica]
MSRKGSNSLQIRQFNERVVLEAIRKLGRASKAEIARSANLTPQAVAGIVDSLHEAGYVVQAGKRHGQIGQPSVLYMPNAERAFSIGLHVGRRALNCLMIDLSGKVLHRLTHEYAYPIPDEVAAMALAGIAELESRLPQAQRERLVGIGVSIPYFLGSWQSDLGFPDTIAAAWGQFNLPDYLIKHTEYEVFFENDSSAAATAQLLQGRGTPERDFIYLYLSTIIGGGLVLGGNIETGPHGNAAAFNTFPVSPSQLSSVTPPKGHFELLQRRASVFVLLKHLRANGVQIERASQLAELGAFAEPYLREWQEDCADALAQAIIGAASVVDVEAIIIDGILPPGPLATTVSLVQSCVAALAPEGFVAPAIRQGELGPSAAAIGAAVLPFYANFAPNNEVLANKFHVAARPFLRGNV